MLALQEVSHHKAISSAISTRWCGLSDAEVIAIDAKATVLFLPEPARRALVSNRWPMQIHDGQLGLIHPRCQERLSAFLTAFANDAQSEGRLVLPIANDGSVSLIQVRWCSRALALLVTVQNQQPASVEDIRLLRQVFGFTPREAEVASTLAGGMPLNAYVERTDMTRNTVKTHLKQVFRKTGVRSQAQLVAVVHALMR